MFLRDMAFFKHFINFKILDMKFAGIFFKKRITIKNLTFMQIE